jgi:hypothetical protein
MDDKRTALDVTVVSKGNELFIIVDGKKIAKRERGSKAWVPLVPGWEVREAEDSSEFEVTFQEEGS